MKLFLNQFDGEVFAGALRSRRTKSYRYLFMLEAGHAPASGLD
jgi:hypothetical protein